MDAQVTEHFECRMERLGEIELYHDGEDWVESESVWKRPLRPQAFPYTTFDSVTQSTLFNYSSLTMNRTLTALYEQDFLYLPAASDNIIEDLKTAYSPPLRALANELIAPLEEKVLGVLQRQVKVGGGWNKDLFKCFLAEKLEPRGEAVQDSLSLIQSASDPQLMVKLLLMQHAVDFLPESSHMARFAKGDYGDAQSAVFRVLLDEFGYGKHATKHSTLFKATLKSIGMLDNSHAYWNFYLTSSLLNNNYFHKLTRSPECFFEYVGAITYAENSFGPYCGRVRNLLLHTSPMWTRAITPNMCISTISTVP